ncbi:unnamed protein product [Moneuplotes crassus]|uniref:Uncharacterized protein n=1 Tax=Euplotes crassus TaxID=5936 RepID=A0AAD1Y5E5_EUPCR|nr:unnamed protein product [Moneuplotes crassus]
MIGTSHSFYRLFEIFGLVIPLYIPSEPGPKHLREFIKVINWQSSSETKFTS